MKNSKKIIVQSACLTIGLLIGLPSIVNADVYTDMKNRCLSIDACKNAVNMADAAKYEAACASVSTCASQPAFIKYTTTVGSNLIPAPADAGDTPADVPADTPIDTGALPD